MKVPIFGKEIHKIDLSGFKSYHVDPNEFYGPPGKEHYKLLAYLSTLYKDSIIFDIGTHMGSSSLALSYNPSNTIHTFDIVDKLATYAGPLKKFNEAPNIVRHYDNLFDPEVQKQYESLLLSAPFLFVDVDPHDGDMEIAIYDYLKSINYPGVIVFDDIHYFEGMRKFWAHVDEQYKYDLTGIGHWSGTGMVIFNPEIVVILK
jgi:predicted O-methyltransferase YrrM